MNTISLSLKQKEIVNTKDGALLVKANAGSGKTRVLTERIKFLLPKSKRKILAITFTNKAGEEMRDRLKDLDDLSDRLFIGTFHGFCQQVLESHGNLIGLSKMPHIFEDESDRLKIIEEALLSSPYYNSLYQEKNPKEQKSFLYDVLGFISEAKRKLLSEQQLLEQTKDQDNVLLFKDYQDILFSQNAIDFDDLILLTYNLFATQPSIASLYRRTYEYICIDEAQDLNNAQYQLLKIITGDEHKNLMMVGDPNQSIFAFNGSSSDFMNKEFIKDFNPLVIELKENYRSAKKVLQAAERILPNSNDISNTIKEGVFQVVETGNEDLEAKWIYEKIKELIETKTYSDIEGIVTSERIVILARNKYVFTPLERIFKEKEIPYYYKVTPGAIKYESDLMKIFDLALKVKVNPQDTLHLNRLKVLINVNTGNSIEELIENVTSITFKQLLNCILLLNEDGSNFKTSINGFSKFINDAVVGNDNDKSMILKDIDELQAHWYNYATKTERKTLTSFKNSMALGQTHPLSQGNGITLSTVHTMKGQEYEIVFLIGMDDETFPDYRAIKAGGIEMTQEKNNLYVAFTRAKRFLFVTWPKERLMPWGDIKRRKISRLLAAF